MKWVRSLAIAGLIMGFAGGGPTNAVVGQTTQTGQPAIHSPSDTAVERVGKGELVPGKEITWRFKHLPLTLADMIHGKNDAPLATVYLPTDYTPKRSFPLVVLVNGADGIQGETAAFARLVMGDRGYICVGLPSFKHSLAELAADNSNYWSRMMITGDDGSFIGKNYRVIFEQILTAVPNIDRRRTVFGGFSNGAHTATAILSSKAEATPFLRLFKNFVLIEGGNEIEPAESLKGCHFFLLRGGKREQSIFPATQGKLEQAGAVWQEYVMTGVEHEFSPAGMAEVRKWIVTRFNVGSKR